MHDIELAVEKGKSGATSGSDQDSGSKTSARMANLEVNISRLTEQVCGRGGTRQHGGGNLARIREFNAMLERAAAVLEGR